MCIYKRVSIRYKRERHVKPLGPDCIHIVCIYKRVSMRYKRERHAKPLGLIRQQHLEECLDHIGVISTPTVLDRSVTPQISIPQIRLPRTQVSQLPNRACYTVAIAFVKSMKAGAPLPSHPQWSSGSMDITTVRDLLNKPNTNGLFLQSRRQQCTKDTHDNPKALKPVSDHFLFSSSLNMFYSKTF